MQDSVFKFRFRVFKKLTVVTKRTVVSTWLSVALQVAVALGTLRPSCQAL